MPKASESGSRALQLLTYNIQVGIGSSRMHHMLSHGWRYVMPHGQSLSNLQRIAEIISGHDIVGLNEADAGSFRTRYINQADFLAKTAGYPFWEQMVTRDLGHVAQHTNSVLCRSAPEHVERHRLPSLMDGRGVLEMRCHFEGRPLMVLVAHLGLGRAGRMAQMRYLAELVRSAPNVVLMGDLNCSARSPEISWLLKNTQLHAPSRPLATFPSWRPMLDLDHILISDKLAFQSLGTIPEPLSDHLTLQAKVRWRD